MSNICPACQPGKLKKPARVGGGTFGVGVAERHVIEAAQRLYEHEGEHQAMTREQEAKRRKLWDMINGPLDTPASSTTAFTTAAQRRSRIYVAGPMTGLPDFNYPAFNAAALELRTQGWHVENPADHGVIDGAEWADYLAYDLTRLGTCGAIYLLPDWELSKGAVLEHHIAQVLGLEVMFAPNAYKTESYIPLSQRMQLGYTALVEIMRSRTVDKHNKELASQAFWALGDAINVWRTQGIKEIHA